MDMKIPHIVRYRETRRSFSPLLGILQASYSSDPAAVCLARKNFAAQLCAELFWSRVRGRPQLCAQLLCGHVRVVLLWRLQKIDAPKICQTSVTLLSY
jgi:hypothetical protein